MANYELTEVYLLNVPLENDYLHTLYFSSKSAQESYFKGKTVYKETDFSYQRKDNKIRYPLHYDDLTGVNYVMYRNKGYTGKWFYAFIVKKEYVNDGQTDIYIETDVMQTYAFDYNIKTSFIEREHTKNDTVGANTVPENVEMGEYTCNNVVGHPAFSTGSFVIGVTVDLNTEDLEPVGGKKYNGIYSGVRYYVMEQNQLNATIERLGTGKAEAITCIFCSPPSTKFCTTTVGALNYAEVDASENHFSFNWSDTDFIGATTPPRATALDGYTPRNKKLLTFPYTYMLMSNNAGSSAIYHYEDFYSSNCDFTIYSAITPGFSIRCVPRYYKNVVSNWEEGINLGKLPVCNWNTDVYTNWLTQNSINIATSIGGSVLQLAGGVALMATGAGALAGAGAIASGGLAVANSVGQIYQHKMLPPQAEGNLNSGDVTHASGNLTFSAHQMTIRKEYAKIIDDYFTMYGYKINRVKVPNKNHRQNYWYTKTININIDGAIPNEELQKIKECYNRGITFWKNPANIQNYNVDNDIIS